MKILYLSHDPFLPAHSGQRIRTHALRHALAAAHEVRVWIPGGSGEGESAPPARRGDRLRMVGALLRGGSLWEARFADPVVRQNLSRTLEEGFDLVVCAGLPSAFWLPADTLPPVWIDEQNVEARIVARAVPHLSGLRRWLASREAPRLEAAERRALTRAALVSACSDEDAQALGGACVLPNLAPDPPATLVPERRPGEIVFTGTLCWGPNVDAALWMAREILPRIRERVPEARLRLVGREPAPEVRALGELPGVEVVGSVPDVWPELFRASLAVAPLRMGSGTRIKILEAAAAHLPVVSTTVGAEGLDFPSPSTLRRADEPASFARACIELLQDPEEAAWLGAAARAQRDRLYGPDAFRAKALELANLAVSR